MLLKFPPRGRCKQHLPLLQRSQMTNGGTIPPKFTLGNQWLYWALLQSMNEGLPTEMWAIQKATQKLFTQKGWWFSHSCKDEVPSSSLSQPTDPNPSPRPCAIRAELHTKGAIEWLGTLVKVLWLSFPLMRGCQQSSSPYVMILSKCV